MAIEVRERKYQDSPIFIRAHHLPHMAWAMGLGEHAGTPGSVAAGGRKDIEGLLKSKDSEERRYAYGIVGERGQYGHILEKVTREEMEHFVNAHPKQVCVIVENRLDDVCRKLRRCGLGDHCLEKTLEEFELFLDIAKEYGLSRGLRVETVKTTFSEAPSGQGRKLYTTVGVVKKVLKHMAEVDGI